jgi:hypothetical protein
MSIFGSLAVAIVFSIFKGRRRAQRSDALRPNSQAAVGDPVTWMVGLQFCASSMQLPFPGEHSVLCGLLKSAGVWFLR